MTSLFDVKGQTLAPLETFDIVSETVNYLTFAFMFSYDWAGLTKSALFTKGDDEYEVVLVNDAITADRHVNLSAGEWMLSVVGSTVVDAVVTKQITTTPYTFTVTQADAVEGEMFPPSIASQVYVNVNQATPQTFVGGIPKLAADREISDDNDLVDKKHVADVVATVTADGFNHNDLSNKQGGTAGEYYHTTQAQNAALHAHSNKTALDAVSGTNTGDQDVSGAISTHNTDAGAHATLIDAIDDINEYGYNLKNGLLAYRLALADVGRNPIKIAAIGTSITFGKWASDVTLTSWSGRIRTAMQNKYGNVGRGNYVPGVDAGEQSVHTWWTFSGAWSFNSNYGIGGKGFYGQGNDKVATLVFTGTSIDLIYQKASNGSVNGVTVTIDGVSQTPPDFSGSAALGQVKSYTGLADGSHTMVITADATAGKYCYIEGAIAYNPILSGDRGCYLFEYGCPSGTASYFTAGSSRLVPATGAKLVIIELGANDTADTASFYTNMQTIISNIKANARTSVLLLTPYHFYGVNTANLDIINGMLYTLADTYNCALIDMDKRFGESYAAMDALGVWGSGSYNGNEGHDGVHPSDKGHRFMADTILSVIS